MKKISIVLVFAGLFSVTGFGQDNKKIPPPPSFSIGIEGAFPANDLALISSMGIGMRMQTVTPFCQMAGVSFSGGFTCYSVTRDAKTLDAHNFIAFPAEAGVRLFSAKGLYCEPETGFTFFSGKSGGDIAFTYAFNVGVRAGSNLDFSFGYENAPYKGLKLSHAGVNIAYVFH